MSEYGADAAYDRGDAVCVIGAGVSGLLALKNLREHGYNVDCYEKGTAIGGGWNVGQRSSPMYANTYLISSRSQTEFPDFPMPDDWPDYPHHTQVLEYLEKYTEHFGLREHIWFGSEIERIEPADRGRFDIIVKPTSGTAARRLRYAAVIIANGHNWDPYLPEIEGQEQFRGEILHSASYQDSSRFRGKKVLIVGGGNSGCDIVCDSATVAAKTWHSTRRGYWYTPKYVLGRPADEMAHRLDRLPKPLRRRAREYLVKKLTGDPRHFGLQPPDHRLDESHPVVNSHLLHYLGHGAVTAKPDIARFDGRKVIFTDDTSIEPDIVVMATGYRPRYDFCDRALLGIDGSNDGYPQLFAQMFSPIAETLFVVGMLQADAGVFPLVHWQTLAIAKWLHVRTSDPERAKEFRAQIIAESTKKYVASTMTDSPRHRLEVSTTRYLDSITRIINSLDKEPDGAL